MAKTRIITGIELGSSKVSTIVAQVQVDPVSFAREINVLGVSSIESKGIRKGQIVNIEEAVDVTISSVEAAERMAGYNIDSAYVALGGAHISSQNSHGVVAVSGPNGEITENDIERVIEAASAVSLPSSRQIVHVLPREFIVDGESGVRDAVGMSGVRLEVQTHLVTASSAVMKNISKALDGVGVSINDFVFSGLASGEAVLTKTERELGCVLIDMGGGTTSIAAYTEGALSYSADIPIGANNVTNDLAIGLRVSLESAEKIKLALSEFEKKEKRRKKVKAAGGDQVDLQEMGVSESRKVSRKTLSGGVIKPRLDEVFTMIRLQLEKEELAARVPSGAVLTGGGAETVGVVNSAKRALSLPVRVGKPRGVGGLVDDIINPSFATPVGLVIYAANQEQSTGLSIGSRFSFPSVGIAGKLIGVIKDLLP
jgi:cell division protein FtsA